MTSTEDRTHERTEAGPGPGAQTRVVLLAVLMAYLAQMTLNPIIAPLSREAGLAEWQIGLTISTAAVMVVLTSRGWGRRSQSWGRRRVLVAALVLATAATALFAAVSGQALRGGIPPVPLFVLFLLLRGVLFGTAIAAVAPTAQAFIADVAPDEPARVRGMAGVGAAQGLAMVAGSVLGGALSAAGLMAPLVAVPLLLALTVVLVLARMRPPARTELVAAPRSVSPRDPRVWPFLVAGFGMFTALGFIQVITGFIVQDRLGLDASTTGLVTGGALLCAGLGMILAQAIIVPRTGWTPVQLLRRGGAVALAGFLVMVPDAGAVPLLLGIGLIGLGLGAAMPGYSSGPMALMEREEQGGLAGLIGSVNGLTFVIAPTAGSALYGVWAPLPVIVGAATMALVTGFVMLHPRFR